MQASSGIATQEDVRKAELAVLEAKAELEKLRAAGAKGIGLENR